MISVPRVSPVYSILLKEAVGLVENIAHCEFAYLRDLLIRTHMQNIKDITSSIHYEVYRVRRLNETNAQPNGQPPNTLVNPQPQQANGVAAQHQVLTHEM
ncbi:hypothetical protein J4Q44_G00285780 [Coregonus suidteri]|uniref:Septin-type G domain-containing protein n=1 Tax=Coregonus suidteri TaxID=861788 RepID=A0AAN8L3G7_9TELE